MTLSKTTIAKNQVREWARQNDRDLFLELQKRGVHADFHHLFDPSHKDYGKRFNLFRGGRGGGRTTSLARIIVDLMADRKLRIAAARSFQNSIAESNKQAIEEQIEALGLSNRFSITQAHIECDTGSWCIFRGLERNTQSIKSLQSVDILWGEESDGLSQRTIDIVEPTIRKSKSQIWLSWNPSDADNPVEKIEATYGKRVVVRHTNFTNNPWCPQTLIDGAEALKAADYERYLHVYEGAYWSASEASIWGSKIRQYPFEIDPTYGTPLIGVDWGFSQDPTAVVECYVRGRTLFVRRAAAKVRLELEDTADWLANKVPDVMRYVSYADCARPETISHVNRKVRMMRGVKKYAGSVEDGVEFVRSFEEIVVHPECQPDCISELRAYSYKIDSNDNVTSIIVDKDNHYADAVRYALETKIKRKGGLFHARLG